MITQRQMQHIARAPATNTAIATEGSRKTPIHPMKLTPDTPTSSSHQPPMTSSERKGAYAAAPQRRNTSRTRPKYAIAWHRPLKRVPSAPKPASSLVRTMPSEKAQTNRQQSTDQKTWCQPGSSTRTVHGQRQALVDVPSPALSRPYFNQIVCNLMSLDTTS